MIVSGAHSADQRSSSHRQVAGHPNSFGVAATSYLIHARAVIIVAEEQFMGV